MIDDYMDDEDEGQDDDWHEGTCDNCSGGDQHGVTATGALGPLYCACRIGQGADAENCRCGPGEGGPR